MTARAAWWSRAAAVAAPVGTRALGAILLVAAVAKAVDLPAFEDEIIALIPLPPAAARAFALAILGLEAGLGTALVTGERTGATLLLANALFATFVGIAMSRLAPGAAGSSCGCFGRLLERSPVVALAENLAFFGLSLLAWIPGGVAARMRRRWPPLAAALACAGFALLAPGLPLDDLVTDLAPGRAVAATGLGEVLPELATGRHLVVLLDRRDPAAAVQVSVLNDRLRPPEGAVRVWGVADRDPEAAAAFLWTAAPAFDVREAPRAVLRRLHRALPRSALVEDGRVVRTWSGLPDAPALDALARGDLP